MKEAKQENNEILVWICKECGKKITSIYPEQLENNKSAHETVHDIADKHEK